jgi:hypothetical protein
MGSERAQRANDFLDFIFLKQADARNTDCSSLHTGCGVFYRNATESEDGNFCPAGFPQGSKARRSRSGRASFPEYGSKDDEVSFLGLGAQNIGGRVTGGGHEKVVSGQCPVGRMLQNRAHFLK